MTPEELAEKRERVRLGLASLIDDMEIDKLLQWLASEGVKIVDEKEAEFHHGYFPKTYDLTESEK